MGILRRFGSGQRFGHRAGVGGDQEAPGTVSLVGTGFGVRLGSGKPRSQKGDLTGVMRLMLANMEPLAIIVSRSPRPVLIHGHQPRVVALAEFRQGFLACLLKSLQIVIEIRTLDGVTTAFPRFMAASHFSFTAFGQLPHFIPSNVFIW